MKTASLIAATSVILLANALALVHAARNRAGTPDAEIVLTQRELRYYRAASADDDSGVILNLQWTGPGQFLPVEAGADPNLLDAPKLRQLGFDCGVDPSSKDAPRFYQRQRPRRAFVAFEYDGPAWQRWLDAYQRSPLYRTDVADSSHLVAIDADPDPAILRSHHPDRTKVLIVPAVVALNLTNYSYPRIRSANGPPGLLGYIREVPSSIHVPLPFSEEFRKRGQGGSYTVKLRYGSAFEPEVTGVEFTR